MKKINKILIPTVLSLIVSMVVGCGITNPTSSDDPTSEPTISNPEESVTTNEETSINDPSSNITSSDDISNDITSEDPSITDPSSDITSSDEPSISYPSDYDLEEQTALEAFNDKYSMDDFFGTKNFIKINIQMDKGELFQLSEDYDLYPHHSSPIYHPCTVTLSINDDYITLKKVGIRLKGNTSRRKFATENGEIYNTVHFKLDFTEIFDSITYSDMEEERIDDRKFLGMKKLDIKWNKNYDSSHIKEYVAANLYREFNVKSQHIGFSQVVLNNTNLGLYYTYETIDKQFTKKYYSKAEQGGDLYKICYTAAGPADFTSAQVGRNVGEEDEEANNRKGFFPSYDIKTNEDETDHSDLLTMIETLNNKNASVSSISEVVDIDKFYTYEAVSYVLGDPDDLRNNFNNSYLYFNNDTGLAEILPYDKDRMFGTTVDWNPTGNGMVLANPQSNWAQGAQVEQRNPLYIKLLSRPIEGTKSYIDDYMNLIKTIFETSTSIINFNSTFEEIEKLYEDIVIPDNDLPYVNFTLDDTRNLPFNSYITQKYEHFMNKYKEYFGK